MNNTILILDLLTGSLNVIAQLQALLQKAATEGRDVTDEEVATLRQTREDLEKEILNS